MRRQRPTEALAIVSEAIAVPWSSTTNGVTPRSSRAEGRLRTPRANFLTRVLSPAGALCLLGGRDRSVDVRRAGRSPVRPRRQLRLRRDIRHERNHAAYLRTRNGRLLSKADATPVSD